MQELKEPRMPTAENRTARLQCLPGPEITVKRGDDIILFVNPLILHEKLPHFLNKLKD